MISSSKPERSTPDLLRFPPLRRIVEAGIMDNFPRPGWRLTLVDALGERRTGHTPDKKKTEYWNGKIRWVSLTDSPNLNHGVILGTAKTITAEGVANSSANILPAGTVVMTRDADVGRVAVLGNEMAVSQHFIAWICDGDLNNWFLYYWLFHLKKEFERIAVGSTIKTIGFRYFDKLPVLVPPRATQDAIVEILATWDQALDHLDQLIDAKTRYKKALAHKLLTGKLRFPEFVGSNKMRETKFGLVSEDWEFARLGDKFEHIRRKIPTNRSDIVTASITSSVGFVDQREKWGREMSGKSRENYTLLKRGEYSYNKGNSKAFPQGCVYMLKEFDEAAIPHVYISFSAKSDDLVPEYYRHYFGNGLLNRQLCRVINSGVRNDGLLNLSVTDFFNVNICVPTIKEQKAIADVLDVLDEELSSLDELKTKIQNQKRGLMQKLLTGQWTIETEEA